MTEHLHPYWRMQYIQSLKDPKVGSPFASLLAEGDDKKSLILYRGPTCFVILNSFWAFKKTFKRSCHSS
jgi:ATP adenylyltransferase